MNIIVYFKSSVECSAMHKKSYTADQKSKSPTHLYHLYLPDTWSPESFEKHVVKHTGWISYSEQPIVQLFCIKARLAAKKGFLRHHIVLHSNIFQWYRRRRWKQNSSAFFWDSYTLSQKGKVTFIRLPLTLWCIVKEDNQVIEKQVPEAIRLS